MKGMDGRTKFEGDKPFLMRNDVDPELTLLVLDQVDVGVDTLSLVSLPQLGCNKRMKIFARSDPKR